MLRSGPVLKYGKFDKYTPPESTYTTGGGGAAFCKRINSSGEIESGFS